MYGNDDYAQTVTEDKNLAFLFYHGYREKIHLVLGCRVLMMKLYILILMTTTKSYQQPAKMKTKTVLEMY